MTKLTPDHLITRETAELERTRAIVVRLHPKYLEVRLKGTRESYNLDYATLLDICRKRAVRDRMAIPKVGRKKR